MLLTGRIWGNARIDWYETENRNNIYDLEKIIDTSVLNTLPENYLYKLWTFLINLERPYYNDFQFRFICRQMMGENDVYFPQKFDNNSPKLVWEILLVLLHLTEPSCRVSIKRHEEIYQKTLGHCRETICNSEDPLKIICCSLIIKRIIEEIQQQQIGRTQIYYHLFTQEQEEKIINAKYENVEFDGKAIVDLLRETKSEYIHIMWMEYLTK
jgi:hypothetical protein